MNDEESVNKKELLRHARSLHIRFAKRTMALPLGTPNFVLIYRADVLEKLNIEPPTTWSQYNALLTKLSETQTLEGDDGEDLPTDSGFALSGTWAAHTFLSRAAAYARYRGKLSTVFDRDTMDPLIATEPFVRALQEFKEDVSLSGGELTLSPKQVYLNLISGKLATGITWPSAHQNDSDAPTTNEQLRIARVPGSEDWFDTSGRGWSQRPQSESRHVDYVGYDGLLVSVNAKSGHSITAQEFVSWLPGKSISLATIAGSEHSGPFRASHLGNPTLWTGESIPPDAAMQYADIVKQINEESVVLTIPRIPGREEYLAALSDAVVLCLKGELEPQAALDSTAEKWIAITERYDVLKQKANLKRGEDF